MERGNSHGSFAIFWFCFFQLFLALNLVSKLFHEPYFSYVEIAVIKSQLESKFQEVTGTKLFILKPFNEYSLNNINNQTDIKPYSWRCCNGRSHMHYSFFILINGHWHALLINNFLSCVLKDGHEFHWSLSFQAFIIQDYAIFQSKT